MISSELWLVWIALTLVFYPNYGNLSQNVMTHRGKKTPDLNLITVAHKFCSSATFSSLCTSRTFLSAGTLFSPDSPTQRKTRFYKPLCNVGSAVTRTVFNCMCSTLSSYDCQAQKIVTELIILSEVGSSLLLLEQLGTTILVHPQTYLLFSQLCHPVSSYLLINP